MEECASGSRSEGVHACERQHFTTLHCSFGCSCLSSKYSFVCAPCLYARLHYKGCDRLLLHPRLEAHHVPQDDAPAGELHQACLLELIERLGDCLPQCSDHIAQFLVRDLHHLIKLLLAEPHKDRGNACRNTPISHLFETRLAQCEALTQHLDDPQRHLWVRTYQPLNISAAQDTDQRVFERFGIRIAHRFPEERHLPEEGARLDHGQLQPLAGRRQAIEPHAPALEQEERFDRILL